MIEGLITFAVSCMVPAALSVHVADYDRERGLITIVVQEVGATTRRLGTLSDMEKAYITEVLTATSGRVKGPGGAAEILDMQPSTLYYRMKKLGIK